LINPILEAVAGALRDEFGEGYEIYAEPIPQGTQEPCFFVLLLNSSIRRVMDNRYRMTNQICIQYLPSDKVNPNLEGNDIMERLMTTADEIFVDNAQLHGTNIHFETTDEVLSMFINYDLFVYREKIPAELMKYIEITQNVKGE
jgi:hypothetical protein